MDTTKNILVVDDEPEILAVLKDLLDGFGYRVETKPDAESAMLFIRTGAAVDLVITDLRLPGMSGEDFISALRAQLPDVPVIMLTAYGTVQSYIRTRSNGVFEYINKPVQAKELRRIVKAALDGPGA